MKTRSDFQGAPAGVTAAVAALAAGIFAIIFTTDSFGPVDFWWKMAFAGTTLVTLCAALVPGYRRSLVADLPRALPQAVAVGLASAAVLYGVFAVGNELSRRLFSFAGQGIDSVYAFEGGASAWRIGLLIGLVIGPAEELFWRGFLQRELSSRWGGRFGFIAATALYAAVHLPSGNPMLVLAALVCGLFWGALYLATKSVWLNVVSHTVWDLAVFLWFPFFS